MSETIQPLHVEPKPAGFFRDLMTVAGRALRAIPREKEYLLPALIIPVFFFAVNVGSLESIGSFVGAADFKAFQLPVAIVFAVTGISRANALVTDIQSGYFDRLLVSPVNRLALLLGLMVADLTLVIALSIPVVIMGLLFGVHFATGILGALVFFALTGLWGLAFTGFSYAIALKTGSPAAVGASFILFFPFTFLTTIYMPLDRLGGWFRAVANVNPVTYLLDGLRSLILEGWNAQAIVGALIAIGVVGFVSLGLAFLALIGRVKRK